jgi:hypothetical protein
VILFGNRIFAGVIKLRSCQIDMGLELIIGVFIRGGDIWIKAHREGTHEIRVISTSQSTSSCQKLEVAREDSSRQPWEVLGPCNTLVLGFSRTLRE